MTVQFFIHNTLVEKKDAFALLESVSEESSTPVKIDLSKHIKASFLKSDKLFDLAVKNNNRDLVDLAWKFAAENNCGDMTKAKSNKVTLRYERALPEGTNAEKLIEFLVSHDSQWAAGAALLLKTANTVDSCTIKEVAVNYVNNTGVPDSSAVLKGFNYNMDIGKYEPIEAGGKTERMKTFHVSPLYMSLREGLTWCRTNKLVAQENTVSYGGSNLIGDQASKMQRVVYKISITEKGREIVDLWADIDMFIDKYWARR